MAYRNKTFIFRKNGKSSSYNIPFHLSQCYRANCFSIEFAVFQPFFFFFYTYTPIYRWPYLFFCPFIVCFTIFELPSLYIRILCGGARGYIAKKLYSFLLQKKLKRKRWTSLNSNAVRVMTFKATRINILRGFR